MSNEKVMTIHSIVGVIKKTLFKIRKYFTKSYEPSEEEINVKVGLLDYATNLDLNAAGVDTSKLAAQCDLASLKAERDKKVVNKIKLFQLI